QSHSFPILQLRPPPTRPLFPYTTLFRSKPSAPITTPECTTQRWPIEQPSYTITRGCRRVSSPTVTRAPRIVPASMRQRAPILERDRKSTRLNSSHVSISYAVFCLKKKKL